ncbi:dienelactone hydrolase family protein [Nocardia sp. NBC_01503]|uniref:dienelactone hydrolase family protein n=1 Tax=Nocardia sp. NBC_01503 TaxID=2975997 RepID=UPI002E7BD7A9|nr:dienelactone hydrolase family protein [Nocardia sp. NBC_01503]WTL31780.1 dienelactone hydrolase family protein [Nocardia sp. NBC_01503]
MVTIALFHSVYGLRSVETEAGGRLRDLGHEVHVPDLYAGQVASTLEAGFALKDRIGWGTIVARALEALAGLPDTTVLAGFSMGCGIIEDVLPSRPAAAGVLLIHALADIPLETHAGVQVHIAEPDVFVSAERLAAWRAAALRHGTAATVHTYPGAGHFYTDNTLPDFDPHANELTWQRTIEFLAHLDQEPPRVVPTVDQAEQNDR